jgi:DNA-binding CsgD family transcriptional regulator
MYHSLDYFYINIKHLSTMESNENNQLPADFGIDCNGKRLTLIDLRILSLAIHGKTRDQQGVILHVARKTIDSHLARIFDRMQVGTIQQAVVKGMQCGLDDKGNLSGVYLFDAIQGLPWPEKK